MGCVSRVRDHTLMRLFTAHVFYHDKTLLPPIDSRKILNQLFQLALRIKTFMKTKLPKC